MSEKDRGLKQAIQEALAEFGARSLQEAAIGLLGVLGYKSERRFPLQPNTADTFVTTFAQDRPFNRDHALMSHWQTVDVLFQLTDSEIQGASQGELPFLSKGTFDGAAMESYLFFAIDLKGDRYTRTQLAGITRAVNRLFNMPVMLIFKHGDTITLSIIRRRLHKRDESKDVLEKVTLIKDIHLIDPHRAHIEILYDLSLPVLRESHPFANFVQLHEAWRKTLDISELNKRFYRELANWYFWAVDSIEFPADTEADRGVRNAVSVIRLITRLIFVWFIREKGLVPDALFNEHQVKNLLRWNDFNGSTYYKAVLQNLFFATLNTEMNRDKSESRKFRGKRQSGRDQHYMIHNVFRYEDSFVEPEKVLQTYFDGIPFLNGGLFECLDKEIVADGERRIVRVDGFSDRKDNPLKVPDELFFADFHTIDLNEVYGTRNKRYEVRGIINLLNSYKFTINENTPIEEEVALDPELLGKVFENLLASYNPETRTTARKQTGSYYTPREIVDYMVDESLKAYLKDRLVAQSSMSDEDAQAGLDLLFQYTEKEHAFTEAEPQILIEAIDGCKILDPACGSGAFPMGVLHKLVYILGKLDPGNARWRELQREKAIRDTEEAFRIGDQAERQKRLLDIDDAFENNASDYGRKLYLIENCIYGVDIQPIAVQIAKLRFFISLVVDQRTNPARENLGIRPLPNLETKFVAANTLMGIDRKGQGGLRFFELDEKEKELRRVRQRHFLARTRETKEKYRKEDARLRTEISELLRRDGFQAWLVNRLAAWDPYDQNASADFFDPEWMFEVTEGFDITVGNPPYVRADSGEEHLAMRQQILASGQYETLWEKWDLFVPFMERSFKLLRPGGITSLIVSDAYCHSKYAKKSQEWFLKNSRILRLDFLSKIKVFDAGVHNLVYFFQKSNGSDWKPERRVHDPEFGMVATLPTDEQARLTYRVFFPEEEHTSLKRDRFVPISSICYVSFGCRPNSDEKKARGQFIVSDVLSDSMDSAHPKPYIEAKEVLRWVHTQRRWLEWDTERSPALWARPTFPELYEVPEKIVGADVSGAENRAAFDDSGVWHSHTLVCFVPWHSLAGVRNKSIKKSARYRGEKPPRSDLPKREELEETSNRFAVKYLLAVMNSTAARDFLRANRRSNIHLYPDDWKKLPIPDAAPEKQAPIVALVDKILDAKRANPSVDVTAFELEIDQLVQKLYGPTEEHEYEKKE